MEKGKFSTEEGRFGGSVFSVILFPPWDQLLSIMFYIIKFWTPFSVVDISLVYAQRMSMMTAGYFFNTEILIMSCFMVSIQFSQECFPTQKTTNAGLT